jgi:hypothetical protein
MTTSDQVSGLIAKLQATGLADMPGKLLYSGIGTLCPGKIYLLGWNPGGDPSIESQSIRDHLLKLAQERSDWNEYLDEGWRVRRRMYAPSDAPMQRRVSNLLTGIGLPVRAVCASNMIFARSSVSEHLVNPAELSRRCWHVHKFILRRVQPKGILTIGKEPFDYILTQGKPLSKTEKEPAGQGTLMCRAVRVQLEAQDVAVVSVPHLGERLHYEPECHPSVIDWVHHKLRL